MAQMMTAQAESMASLQQQQQQQLQYQAPAAAHHYVPPAGASYQQQLAAQQAQIAVQRAQAQLAAQRAQEAAELLKAQAAETLRNDLMDDDDFGEARLMQLGHYEPAKLRIGEREGSHVRRAASGRDTHAYASCLMGGARIPATIQIDTLVLHFEHSRSSFHAQSPPHHPTPPHSQASRTPRPSWRRRRWRP